MNEIVVTVASRASARARRAAEAKPPRPAATLRASLRQVALAFSLRRRLEGPR